MEEVTVSNARCRYSVFLTSYANSKRENGRFVPSVFLFKFANINY